MVQFIAKILAMNCSGSAEVRSGLRAELPSEEGGSAPRLFYIAFIPMILKLEEVGCQSYDNLTQSDPPTLPKEIPDARLC